MSIQITKEALHALIDEIDDDELLSSYLRLMELESKIDPNVFDNPSIDVVERAKGSLKSVQEGRTRPLSDFEKDVDLWKKKNGI